MAKSPFGPGNPGPRAHRTLSIGGLSCSLNMPPATKSRFGERGEELTQGLARYAPIDAYRVDDFPRCPKDWQRDDQGAGIASYFMKAQPGHMVWLDFNGNGSHANDVAAIISAQGINAVTGLQVVPPVRLEQYDARCPLHEVPFVGGNKHCPDCGFEWPSQNYISTTTCGGAFWRDGFRGKDGKTREFVFTEDESRGVAAALIGDERVNAFGAALFLSKEPKPRPQYRTRGGLLGADGPQLESFGATRSLRSKSVEVGAGALVNQSVARDPNRLDFWQESASAFILVYYAGPEEFAEIVGGSVPTGGSSEGFLGGIPTGNE